MQTDMNIFMIISMDISKWISMNIFIKNVIRFLIKLRETSMWKKHEKIDKHSGEKRANHTFKVC